MKASGRGGLSAGPEIRELRRRMAEACGGRTHQPVISGFAGFEDQEGHRAHSASILLNQVVRSVNISGPVAWCPFGVYGDPR